MSGLVSQHIRALLTRQVTEHGVVVWYDADAVYTDAFQSMDFGGEVKTYSFTDSYYQLRHDIDKHLNGNNPPRLLIYVPVGQEETNNALIGIESLGIVVKPGQQPPTRNTRLSIIARNALRPILGDEAIGAIEKQVDEGQLTLADLDKLAESGGGRGVIAVIFGSSIPGDVGLAFLASEDLDERIIQKKAIPELCAMFATEFEIDLSQFSESAPDEIDFDAEQAKLKAIREVLSRHVLCTDLNVQFGEELPAGVAAIPVPTNETTRSSCSRVATHWRQRRDLRDSYATSTANVAGGLNLDSDDHAFAHKLLGQLVSGNRESIPDTFAEVETGLQQAVVARLLDQKESQQQSLVDFCVGRQSSFWAEQSPDVQAQWALIAATGRVLLESDRIEAEVKKIDSGTASKEIGHLYSAYTSGDQPWCLIDTAHRRMEKRYHDFPFNLTSEHERLESLINLARDRYMSAGSQMAETFTRSFVDAGYEIPEVGRQTQVYHKFLKPNYEHGKVAYVWVDALRFEMAQELAAACDGSYEIEFDSVIGTVPTITEIGMPSLLPIRDGEATVVDVGKGKLALQIGDKVIKARAERIAFLEEKSEKKLVAAKLEDFLPSPKRKLQREIGEAELILITSQEIDRLGEEGNVPLARRLMDDLLLQLRRLFSTLAQLDVARIVVVADHGHLFGEERMSDMKIEAPRGETADLHRRVWVGKGGNAGDGFLRGKLSAMGLSDELEFAVPWGFACFKTQGDTSYFHGGLSPQELIIPVMTLTPKADAKAAHSSPFDWKVELGSKKITARFVSIQLSGSVSGLFDADAPEVIVEVRNQSGAISNTVAASYGFSQDTGSVQMKMQESENRKLEPNTITLMIVDEPDQKTVSIRIIDATSAYEHAKLDKIDIELMS